MDDHSGSESRRGPNNVKGGCCSSRRRTERKSRASVPGKRNGRNEKNNGGKKLSREGRRVRQTTPSAARGGSEKRNPRKNTARCVHLLVQFDALRPSIIFLVAFATLAVGRLSGALHAPGDLILPMLSI